MKDKQKQNALVGQFCQNDQKFCHSCSTRELDLLLYRLGLVSSLYLKAMKTIDSSELNIVFYS